MSGRIEKVSNRKAGVPLAALSAAAVALDELCVSNKAEDAALVDVLYRKVIKQNIWKYRRGKQKPSTRVAFEIEAATNGRVPASEWNIPARPPKVRGNVANDVVPQKAAS